MRARFEIQLETLNQGVTEMGALVEEALEHAIDALVHENREVAEKNIVFDREIDQKMKEIEKETRIKRISCFTFFMKV